MGVVGVVVLVLILLAVFGEKDTSRGGGLCIKPPPTRPRPPASKMMGTLPPPAPRMTPKKSDL